MGYSSRIYTDENLPHRAKLVYFYLCDRCDKRGVCWPSIRRIGLDLSLSRSTVKRAVRDLEQAGYILAETAYRENGSFTSNRYRILWFFRGQFPPRGFSALTVNPVSVHHGPTRTTQSKNIYFQKKRKQGAASLGKTFFASRRTNCRDGNHTAETFGVLNYTQSYIQISCHARAAVREGYGYLWKNIKICAALRRPRLLCLSAG
jgi:DNA-binding transcriptional MocR family regulator